MSSNTFSLITLSHIPRKVGPQVQARINALKVGQKMQDLPEELWHESFRYYVKEDPNRCGGPNLRILRLDPRKPSPTVTGYVFNKFVHPSENRYITPREAARLQGFPDSFLFSGTLTSVQRQIGNAVPVPLAAAAGQAVLEHAAEHRPLGIGDKFFKDGRLPVLSLFSGAGGMDVGVMQAKCRDLAFDVKTCVELDRDCCKTLRNNFGGEVTVVEKDIAQFCGDEAAALCGAKGVPLPLVVGGPPCQAFSQAGKQKGAGDARGQMIFEFLRVVNEARPAYFVMENVPNLRGIAKGELLAEIQGEIGKMGYNATCSLLCAADYGAPQTRRRIFLIGVQKPFPAVQPPFPTHGDDGAELFNRKPYVGVGEAFRGLPKVRQTEPSPERTGSVP